MELAARHPSGVQNFYVTPGPLENLRILDFTVSCISGVTNFGQYPNLENTRSYAFLRLCLCPLFVLLFILIMVTNVRVFQQTE
jgi:hypothetical protein